MREHRLISARDRPISAGTISLKLAGTCLGAENESKEYQVSNDTFPPLFSVQETNFGRKM